VPWGAAGPCTGGAAHGRAWEGRFGEEQLRQRLAAASGPVRPRIAQLSAEVVDSNPYSRLMALKRMGVVNNYEVRCALLGQHTGARLL
jgi:hypothetical protein